MMNLDEEEFCEVCGENIIDCECDEEERPLTDAIEPKIAKNKSKVKPAQGKKEKNEVDVTGKSLEHKNDLEVNELVKEEKEEVVDSLINEGFELEKIGKSSDALKSFVKALEAESEEAVKALYRQGLEHGRMARFTEAMDCFNRALEIRSGDPEILYSKACIRALEGEKKEVIEILMQAVEKKPQYKKSIKENDVFDNLKDDPDFKKLLS